jgi:hypothetical protein
LLASLLSPILYIATSQASDKSKKEAKRRKEAVELDFGAAASSSGLRACSNWASALKAAVSGQLPLITGEGEDAGKILPPPRREVLVFVNPGVPLLGGVVVLMLLLLLYCCCAHFALVSILVLLRDGRCSCS